MRTPPVLTVLYARRYAAAVAFALVAALVLGGMLLQPKRYTATAAILIDVKSPDPVAGMVFQGMTSPSYMLTQVDVVQSLRVADRAVEMLQLAKQPGIEAVWQKATGGQGSLQNWLAEDLRLGLDARPSRGSNVINVTYVSSNAAFAAAAANAFVQSYVDTSLEMRVEPAKQYSRFFDAHSKQLRDQLEAAQAKLSAYQRENGIIATDDKLDLEATRLSEMTTQLIALEAVTAESGGRQGQARQGIDGLAEVANDPVVADLRSEIARQNARLSELGSRLGDQHPQVIQLQASITQLRGRLAAEAARASSSVGVNNRVNEVRLAQLRAAIEEQRSKVMRFKGQRDEASVLLQDVANAQRAYDGVLARLNQTSLESQTAQANVSVLEQAVAPSRPSSPRRMTSAVLALVAGLVAAVATAAVRELRDRRLRSAEDLSALFDHVPVMVVPTFRREVTAVSFSPKQLALGRSPAIAERRLN